MKSFGAKVKEQRGNLGLSQKQLAEKAGMGIRTITSYELGERKPYQAQLYKLAKALEVSTEYLQNDNIEDPSYGLQFMRKPNAVGNRFFASLMIRLHPRQNHHQRQYIQWKQQIFTFHI